MKAKVPEGIRLTIGMIVKNEHKHLRNCLEAMKELRERVNCELVIADTGSDDDSLEVAREFADQVLEYKWDGDFAAARNIAYDIARGEWFLFLDADEYLENVEDLVQFLNGKDRKNYFTGTICLRNRLNKDGSVYNEFRAARLFRYDKKRRFIGRIHETIPVIGPVKNLEAFVIHHGYYYETPEEWTKKQKRNMDLMLTELEEHPDDARLLAHIADSASPEDRMQYLTHAHELVEHNATHTYYRGIYRRLASEYVRQEKLEEAVDLLEECFEEIKSKKDVVDLDLRALQAKTLHKLKRYDEAEKGFAAYFDLLDRYKNHKLSLDGAMFGTVDNVRPNLHNEMWELRSYCSQLREDLVNAMEWMCQMDYSLMNLQAVEGHVKRVLLLARDSKDFSVLPKFYAHLKDQHEQEKIEIWYENQEKFCCDIPDFALDVAKAYSTCGINDDYCRLMDLIACQEDTETYRARLEEFIKNIHNFEKGYTETVYLVLKYQMNLDIVTTYLNSEQLENTAVRLGSLHKADIIQSILDYPADRYNTSVKSCFFISALLIPIIFNSDNEDEEMKTSIYTLFIKSLAIYINGLYNTNILNEKDIGVLPSLHRFGYYAGLANKQREIGDEAKYFYYMRLALEQDAKMKKVVQHILKVYQKQQESKKEAQLEFENYASKVREKIIEFVNCGMPETAKTLAVTYLKLKPNDKEIEDILVSA